MEKYTVSRELAEKLKEAGYPQSTEWFIRLQKPTGLTKMYWHCDMDYDNERFSGSRPEHIRFREENEFFAAPMTDELLEQLPARVKSELPNDLTLVKDVSNGQYYASYETIDDDLVSVDAAMPVDALAQLWLYCKANGHIKAEEQQS